MSVRTNVRRILTKLAFLRRAVHWIEHISRESLRLLSPVIRVGPPRGTFSLEGEVRAGQTPGRVVSEAPALPMPGQGSLRRLCHDLQLQIDHRLYPVFWARQTKARLVGDTLVPLNERKEACTEAMFKHAAGADPGYQYCWLPAPTRLPGAWISLVALFSQNYYHWVLEALPRLAMLAELPSDVRILVHGKLLPFQEQSLRLLKLHDRIRRTPERHLSVDDFYFLSPASVLGTQHPESLRFLRDSFLPLADPTPASPRSIFILRPGGAQGIRGVINEAEIRAMCAARGWTCLNPDEWSFAQQIHLFSQAERICAVHGGALTNLVWSRAGTKVLELCPRGFLNGCYESLAEKTGLDYRYMLLESEADHRLRLDVTQLALALDRMG